MKLNMERLHANGFSDHQIRQIEVRLRKAWKEGSFDRTMVLQFVPGSPDPWTLVCKTVAEIMEQVRPECGYVE